MATWLTIYHAEQLSWCKQQLDGSFDSPQSGDWSEFAEAASTPLTVLLATPRAMTRTIEVPDNLSMSKLQKSIAYLLEDDMVGDVEDYGCYAFEREGQPMALILDKQTQDVCEQNLKKLNLPVSGVFLLADVLPDQWSLLHGKSSYVHTPTVNFCAGNLSMATLRSYLEQQSDQVTYASTQTDHQDSAVSTVENVAAWVAPQVVKAKALPLRWGGQSEMIPPRKIAKHLGILVGVLFAVLCGIKGAEYFKLKSQRQALEQSIASVYFEIFPEATQVVAPKLRIEQRLAGGASSDDNAFFQIMHPFGEKLQMFEVEVLTLDFKGNRLAANIKAQSYNQIQSLRESLQGALRVQEQNTRTTEEGILTTLLLEESTP